MKQIWTLSLSISALIILASPTAGAKCEPDGEVQFICGPVNPEDFAPLPDSPWVIVSSYAEDGHLYLADSRDQATQVLYPTETTSARHDTVTYAACPGPMPTQFHPHGLYLYRGSGDTHTLLVVRHGGREAIEVFEVGMGEEMPSLTWVGCTLGPEGVDLNSVVALPEGGFAATSPQARNIWEWHSDAGWNIVPGSEGIFPNGIEISADGRSFYVGAYGDMAVVVLSRDRTPVERTPIPVGFHIDNVRQGPDGTVFAAGHIGTDRDAVRRCLRERDCAGITSHVSQVDPQQLTAKEVFRYPSNDYLVLGTVATQVGDELWVGGIVDGNRIARVPAPR